MRYNPTELTLGSLDPHLCPCVTEQSCLLPNFIGLPFCSCLLTYGLMPMVLTRCKLFFQVRVEEFALLTFCSPGILFFFFLWIRGLLLINILILFNLNKALACIQKKHRPIKPTNKVEREQLVICEEEDLHAESASQHWSLRDCLSTTLTCQPVKSRKQNLNKWVYIITGW